MPIESERESVRTDAAQDWNSCFAGVTSGSAIRAVRRPAHAVRIGSETPSVDQRGYQQLCDPATRRICAHSARRHCTLRR
jgi:hypothetical protein